MSLRALYDEASLWMTPSGYEDGKLFSELPTDGSGDFTFSRGSNLAATRVGPTGLIEKGRENLILQSNQFDTTWIPQGTLVGGQADKDGGTSAWSFTSLTSTSGLYQNITTGGVQTFSAYVKKNATNGVRVYMFGSLNAATYFDLNNGSVVSSTVNTLDASIEAYNSEWWRVSVTCNSTLSQINFYCTNNNQNQVVGTITIQDAQLEAGLVATDYIESGATTAKAGLLEDEPRLDYSGGASCPALLLEPQRTNLVSQSEFYGGSDWSRGRCGVVTNTSETLSPEGLYNASKMTSTDASESYAQDNVTLGSTSGTYTFFAKKGDLDYCHALVWDIAANGRRQWFNLATGAVGTTTNFGSGYTKVDATIEDYGNGWYRCSFSWSGGNTTSAVRINISSGDGVIGSPVNSYGYFYGAQVEAGVSYPTSYIPTYGSSVTRSGEFGIASNNNDFTTNSCTMFLEVDIPQGREGAADFASLQAGATTVGWKGVYVPSPIIQLNGNGTIGDSSTFNVSTGVHKLLFKWDNGTAEIFIDGVKELATITDSAAPTTFTTTKVDGGAYRTLQKQLVIFPTALTDSECIKLTTI